MFTNYLKSAKFKNYLPLITTTFVSTMEVSKYILLPSRHILTRNVCPGIVGLVKRA